MLFSTKTFLKIEQQGSELVTVLPTCAQSPDSLNIYEIQTQKTVFAVSSPGD